VVVRPPEASSCARHPDISVRTTFTLDDELAGRARELGINISAAARAGVAAAVREALARSDREAYLRHAEGPDPTWTEAEAWSDE
jgi:post-segregation antitoxin (ccd killing protein)